MGERPAAPRSRTVAGPSLARGPALVLGTLLLAAGLYFMYRQHGYPRFSNFPSGPAHPGGKVFGIFGANGWTGMLTAIAGGLLLFGAAQHLLAKTMSLIVGVVLAAAAIIAVVRSGNVLGLAAANTWTEIGWGASALVLLINTLLPRVKREIPVETGARAVDTGASAVRERRATPVREPIGAAGGENGETAVLEPVRSAGDEEDPRLRPTRRP